MGGGCHQYNGYEKLVRAVAGRLQRRPRHLQRDLQPGAARRVSCPGAATQVLQIPIPATLTVNDPQATTTDRRPEGLLRRAPRRGGQFDQYTTTRGGGFGGGVTYKGPTVTVYVSDDVHTGVPARGAAGNSVWTELLNMTPGSTAYTGLTAAGQSYVDPAGGATITLESISATSAVVR